MNTAVVGVGWFVYGEYTQVSDTLCHALLQKHFSTVAVWHFIVLDYFAGMRYSLLC